MVKQVFDGKEFGRQLRVTRAYSNIDMRTLSKQIGISPSTLSRIENGYTPDVNTFATLSHWIGADMQDFFTSKKIPKKSVK